ncbi:MAG: type II toxin-antitoxin system VapC family toxin [Verrucomicrobiales bacterium]
MSQRLHLDTNAIIALGDPSHAFFRAVEKCLEEGGSVCTDAVAWHEYIRGPVQPAEAARALLILENRVVELTRRTAETAAILFNATGRRRASTADCLIAASCMAEDATLLTQNVEDFKPFASHGLKIARFHPL